MKNDIVMLFDAPRSLLRLPPLWSPVEQEDLMHIYWQFESFFKIIDAARANRYL